MKIQVLDTTDWKCKLFTPLNFWTGSSFVMIIKRDWTFGTWLMLCIGFCSKVVPCRTGIFLSSTIQEWMAKSKKWWVLDFLVFLMTLSPKDYREMTLESCRGTLEGPEWIHTSSSNLFINRPSVTIVVCPSIYIYSIHTSPRGLVGNCVMYNHKLQF